MSDFMSESEFSAMKMNMQKPTFLHIRLKNPTTSVMKLSFYRPSDTLFCTLLAKMAKFPL
jgi:hypothetical protein